jgi:hypothetical protein
MKSYKALPIAPVLDSSDQFTELTPQTHAVGQAPALTAADRPFLYNEDHCWQYDIRVRNAEQDLADAELTIEEVASIKVADLTFRPVDKAEGNMCQRIVQFIKRHEWLGTMPLHPTHRFIAEYKGHLAGAIIMSMPSAFSKLLGENTKDLERLISRGACISWSPKNTASALLMFSINWMVKNTPFRLFTCYADSEAKELGTIYQACNFMYLGQRYSGGKMYCDPDKPKRGYFSDRTFRARSAWKRYAKALGIGWQPEWQQGEKIFWDRIPEESRQKLREVSKAEVKRCQYRLVPRKHKYALIRGKDRRETGQLIKRFAELNPELVELPYPEKRTPKLQMPHNQRPAIAPSSGTQVSL